VEGDDVMRQYVREGAPSVAWAAGLPDAASAAARCDGDCGAAKCDGDCGATKYVGDCGAAWCERDRMCGACGGPCEDEELLLAAACGAPLAQALEDAPEAAGGRQSSDISSASRTSVRPALALAWSDRFVASAEVGELTNMAAIAPPMRDGDLPSQRFPGRGPSSGL